MGAITMGFPRPGRQGKPTPAPTEVLNPLANVQTTPVFNLAQIHLSESELSVLSKGLSFVPTSPTDWYDSEMEIRTFLCKVRLRTFFQEHDLGVEDDEDDTGLHLPSTFTPSDSQVPHDLLTFERCVLEDLARLKPRTMRTRHNLSVTERQALTSLQNNKGIVIKPSDKGGGVVIMSKKQCKAMVLLLLNDRESYSILRKDPTKDLCQEISDAVAYAQERDWISEKETAFLSRPSGRTPCFYALPKIHKDPLNPPGRPIVSGCGSSLEPLCKFVDHFLQPISIQTHTYLKDTTHTISIFEGLPFDPLAQFLVTMDIKSLYTNIPQAEAIKCVREWISADPNPHKTLINFVLELMEIALCKNFFTFDNVIYLQT
ncbi:uncharacterized protein [Ambystoma mexicanum]|uniref:uncharacterized protein n=1 Tax=Ambystoma mexicanum TaxID=8296 RepID=UPI0037E8BF96